MIRLVARQPLLTRWRRWVCRQRGHMPVLGDRTRIVYGEVERQIGIVTLLGTGDHVPLTEYMPEEQVETNVVLCGRCGQKVGD